MKKTLNIQIIGQTGSGKTAISLLIAEFLQDQGFDVNLTDDDTKFESFDVIGNLDKITNIISTDKVNINIENINIETKQANRILNEPQ